jgi:hypothetical protein
MASGDNAPQGALTLQSGGGSSSRVISTTNTYDDGNYHLATFGYDGTDGPVIYADGSEDAAGSFDQYTIAENWQFGTVGSRSERHYQGLGDVAIFHDKRLTLQEHQNLLNTGSINR